MGDDHERRLGALEERMSMTEATVEETQAAVAALTSAFNSFATDVNQTIADLEAREAQGGTITAADLGPIKDSLGTLTDAVTAADTTVKGEDPGPETPAEPTEPAEPTAATVSVPIGANGEGAIQLDVAVSRVTITQQPESGTATITAVEGAETPTTRLAVVSATPESTQTVGYTVAPE